MSIYNKANPAELLAANTYPGRGIIVGKNGGCAVIAYFIMGRSENSRNRIFVEKDNAVFTHPYDASKVQDPSLIIYAPIRQYENNLIVTNGDQTDTVYEGLAAGKSFADALATREFEPDAPNFTPRISAILDFDADDSYKMSILKSASDGAVCNRFFYEYASVAGEGRFMLHETFSLE